MSAKIYINEGDDIFSICQLAGMDLENGERPVLIGRKMLRTKGIKQEKLEEAYEIYKLNPKKYLFEPLIESKTEAFLLHASAFIKSRYPEGIQEAFKTLVKNNDEREKLLKKFFDWSESVVLFAVESSKELSKLNVLLPSAPYCSIPPSQLTNLTLGPYST